MIKLSLSKVKQIDTNFERNLTTYYVLEDVESKHIVIGRRFNWFAKLIFIITFPIKMLLHGILNTAKIFEDTKYRMNDGEQFEKKRIMRNKHINKVLFE